VNAVNILEQIQNQYASFSKNERNIADYILQNKAIINNMNIKDFATNVNTSTSSITRFCKRIKVDGFVDMKIALRSLTAVSPHREMPTIFDDIYGYYTQVIDGTNQMVDNERLEQIIDLIKKANRIFVYGIGSSGLTATELSQRLIRMGLNVIGVSDSHLMIINSSIIKENDLVIGISNSGETIELIESLKIAKRQKAKVVALTSYKNSSLTQVADVNFYGYNSRFVNNTVFVNTQFGLMYLIDVISTFLLQDDNLNYNMNTTIQSVLAYTKNNEVKGITG
jgi:DNA-binding MurR/RpiR family transcriptional regulator